jgi:hypothetical protein
MNVQYDYSIEAATMTTHIASINTKRLFYILLQQLTNGDKNGY